MHSYISRYRYISLAEALRAQEKGHHVSVCAKLILLFSLLSLKFEIILV